MSYPSGDNPAHQDAKDAAVVEETSFRRLVSLGLSARLFTDTAVQLFSPFLTVFAAGLGVDIVTFGRLVSLRSGVGIVAPILGTLADRHGFRRMLRLQLLLGSAGLLLIGLSTSLWMVAPGMILMGVGLSSFVPTLHAYLSGRFPYARRGRGLSIVEYAWALSGIFGLLLMGLLMDAVGWRAPFFVLAVGLVIAYLIFGALPQTATHTTSTGRRRNWRQTVRDFVRLRGNAVSARSSMLVNGLIGFSALNVFIVYGAWLSRSYGLTTTQLGTAALFVGVADLAGSGFASLVVDRAGKRRSVISGTAATAVAFFILPWFDVSVVALMVGLMLTRTTFEFTLVSNIPLMSEQVPAERGKVLSQASMVGLFGFSIGTLVGPWLFENAGVMTLCRLSAATMLLASAVTLFAVREPEPAPS